MRKWPREYFCDRYLILDNSCVWNPKNIVKVCRFLILIFTRRFNFLGASLNHRSNPPRPEAKTLCACQPHGIHSVNIGPMLGPACILYQWRLYLMSPWGHSPPHNQFLTLLQALAEFGFSLATKRIELGNWLSCKRKHIMGFYKVGNRNLKKKYISEQENEIQLFGFISCGYKMNTNPTCVCHSTCFITFSQSTRGSNIARYITVFSWHIILFIPLHFHTICV